MKQILSSNQNRLAVLAAPQPALMTTVQVAKFLGVSPESVRRWRACGTGPAFIRVGSRFIRYRMEDIQAFVGLNDTEETLMHELVRLILDGDKATAKEQALNRIAKVFVELKEQLGASQAAQEA